MRHHPQPARQVALESTTAELRTALLGARRRVTRAPRNPYLVQLRKDIARGHARPCEMLLEVLLTDLLDGAPLEDVTAMPRRLIAILETYARPVPARSIDALIDALNMRETMQQGPMDCVQQRLARDKSDDALREAEAVMEAYDREQDELLAAVRAKRYGTLREQVA